MVRFYVIKENLQCLKKVFSAFLLIMRPVNFVSSNWTMISITVSSGEYSYEG